MSGAIALVRLRDPQLRPIAEKVAAGERLTPAEGVALYADDRSARPGRPRRLRQPAPERRPGLLLRQPAHQSHQRLHPAEHLRVLLLRADAEGRGRLHPVAGGGVPRGRAGARDADPRVPHRRRAPSQAAAELLHRHDPRAQGAAPAGAHQGADRGRDRAPGADREDLRARGAAGHEGGGAHQPARAAGPRCSAPRCGPPSRSGSSPARNGSGCIAWPTSSAFPTNCTMLYGHVETAEDRIDHLSQLRALQDETGGFLTYIPLAYHPDHNELGEEMGRVGTATTGYEDLKNIAVGAAVPRQHSAREDPLADGDAVPVPDRARLRLRRRGGDGGLRADLPRGRRAHRHAPAVSRAGAADPRGREATGRARQPVPAGARAASTIPRPSPACGRGASLPVVHAA